MVLIRKKEKREMPALSTSSLPDIIFMLLFFFMAVTNLKETTYRVRITPPQAAEVQKLENKSLIRYIYVGQPLPQYQNSFGSETRIQLNDAFADISEIESYIVNERSAMREEDQNLMTVCIRADKDTPMGTINEIKEALRKVYALKIVYAANQRNRY